MKDDGRSDNDLFVCVCICFVNEKLKSKAMTRAIYIIHIDLCAKCQQVYFDDLPTRILTIEK